MNTSSLHISTGVILLIIPFDFGFHSNLAGLTFLGGTRIGMEMLTCVKEQTRILAETIINLAQDTDTQVGQMVGDINNTRQELTRCQQRIEEVGDITKAKTAAISGLQRDTHILYSRTDVLEEDQMSLQTKLAAHDVDIQEIQHSTKSLQKEHICLKSRMTDIEDTVADLSEDVESLKLNYSNTRLDEYFFRAPDRLPAFVGRSEELRLLKIGFLNAKSTGHTMAICGLGGIGKTSLAIEYSWLLQALYPGGVFWLSAEDDHAIENSIREIAIDALTEGKDNRETVQRTLRWIASIKERWLLVVDNLDEDQFCRDVQTVLKGHWRRNSNGHLLLTSRRESIELADILCTDVKNCLTLSALEMEDSILFMTKRTGLPHHEDLSVLVEELGGLPLAMEQAAAYMKLCRLSYADYTKKFLEKRLILLNRQKVCHPVVDIPQNRLTVQTTWSINFEMIQCESIDQGMGYASPLVMQVAGFCASDEIPIQLFNRGEPAVEHEDLANTLNDEVDSKEVIRILTRFSLFQRKGSESVCVHRIVQEVIRDSIKNESDETLVLQCVIRMLNFAIKRAKKPFEILFKETDQSENRGALHLWSKLADNACAVQKYISKFVRAGSIRTDFFNIETIRVLHEASIQHSIQQRQYEAFSLQDQMLKMMMMCEIPESEVLRLTAMKVPLTTSVRNMLQSCITSTFATTEEGLANSDELRIEGNKAFNVHSYQKAIQLYTEGIRASTEGKVDERLYINRSLCFRRIGEDMKSLLDANESMFIQPDNWECHAWRSYAIAKLIEQGQLPDTWYPSGLASASLASHLNKQFIKEYQTKLYYPILLYEVIKSPTELTNALKKVTDRPFTTLLLPKGEYTIGTVYLIRSLQIVGIEESVNIHFVRTYLERVPGSAFKGPIRFEVEEELSIHFENVTFVENSSQLRISKGITATLYRCNIFNGKKGCRDFPTCKGCNGCENDDACEEHMTRNEQSDCFWTDIRGKPGYPAICAESGGKVYIDRCILEKCGGGGILGTGDGSKVEIRHSTIRNTAVAGLEVFNGAVLVAEHNMIHDNKMDGVSIGPGAHGILKNNKIFGNSREGIFCVLGSTAVICENSIHHNGFSGVRLNGGSFELLSNLIFDNWCWGVLLLHRSSCMLQNNEIFGNKSGGVRVGHNYSAQVFMDGNTIRDHTGPGLHIVPNDNVLGSIIDMKSNDEENVLF